MSKPLISIVIPTHVRPHLVRRAIESALHQTYQNIEVIVVDDSTGGEGLGVCQKIRDSRVRAYRNRRAKGACGSRNTGIDLARGTFYTGLDDDDYFHQERIEVLLSMYRRSLSFVASNILELRDGVVAARFRDETEIRLADILWGNCVGNQIFSELYKVREVGAFDEGLEAGQDFDLWIRMIERWGAALRIDRCLYTMHLDHGASRIGTTVQVGKRVRDFLDRHGEKLNTAQRLVYSMRARRHEKMPYFAIVAASACFPGTWRYWSKRITKAW